MKFYDSVSATMAKQGINTITGDIYDFISDWKQWYRGNVNNFHTHKVKMANGKSKSLDRLTMNMAKKVSEDLAKLVWTERTKIELDSKKKTQALWAVLDSKNNNFSVNIPEWIEKYMALGTGMLVEYKSNDETMIDYIDASFIIPFEYNNSNITGVLTTSRTVDKSDKKSVWYSLVTIHKYKDGVYSKEHQLYRSDTESSLGDKITLNIKYPDLPETIEYEVDTPHFQIARPNIANNLDTDSPMGISVFANRVDNLKALDTKYDSFNKEYMMGKKRILVDRTAVKGAINPDTGELAQYFDTDDETYMAINGMDSQPVKEIDFTLRASEHIEGINAELNYLSAGVGLGQDFYSFDGVATKTATEVISEQSDTFRSKASHEIILRDAIYDLVKAICHLEGIKSKTISIEFDDSIILDKDGQKNQALIEYNAGLIDQVEYFIKAYDMDEIKAKQLVIDMRARAEELAPEEPDTEEPDEEEPTVTDE